MLMIGLIAVVVGEEGSHRHASEATLKTKSLFDGKTFDGWEGDTDTTRRGPWVK